MKKFLKKFLKSFLFVIIFVAVLDYLLFQNSRQSLVVRHFLLLHYRGLPQR